MYVPWTPLQLAEWLERYVDTHAAGEQVRPVLAMGTPAALDAVKYEIYFPPLTWWQEHGGTGQAEARLREAFRPGVGLEVWPREAGLDVVVRAYDLDIESTYAYALDNALKAAAVAPRGPGRPAGTGQYPGTRTFLYTLRFAFRAARAANPPRPPTKEYIAAGFGINVRTLDYWLAKAGSTWAAEIARFREESEQE